MTQVQVKARVLALHGFRTSGDILRQQVRMAGLEAALTRVADITYLDAPRTAVGPTAPEVAHLFAPPYYEWWNARKLEAGGTVLDGCAEAITYTEAHMAAHGPYHCVLGFSQGAALASTLVAAQQAGEALQGVPALTCAVFIGGLRNRDQHYAQLYARAGTLLCPSLHIIGERDSLRPMGQHLAEAFSDPRVILHPGGHVVPRLEGECLASLLTFVTECIPV